MSNAQVRCDERLETDGVERCPQLPERSPHQAEMDAADDFLVLPRERSEWATAEPDRIARGGRPLRREARLVEQHDEAVDGIVGSGRVGHIDCHRPAPAFPGSHRDRRRLGLEGELFCEDPSEFAVGVGVGILVPRRGNVPQAWPPAARGWGDAAGHEPRLDELVELLADGVRVKSDGLGELAHSDRTVGLTEDGEEPRAGQSGEDTVAVLWRCHGLHFARIWT